MTKEEIKIRIDKLETAIFMEQMADFMNWGSYYKMKNELAELKAELAAGE